MNDPLGYKYSLGTWVVYIYKQGFQEFHFGYASALSVIVFLVTLLLLSLGVIWLSRRNTYCSASPTALLASSHHSCQLPRCQ